MELQNFKFGTRKGFVFTVMTSTILLVLFALVYVYSQVHYPNSINYLTAEQANSIAEAVSKAQQTQNNLNYSLNSTTYFVSEVFYQGKKTQLDSNKNYLSTVLQKLSNKTTANASFSPIDYEDYNLFSSNFNYSWNYTREELSITGQYSILAFYFEGASLKTDNCSSTGGQVELKINDFFDKTPSGTCLIQLNASNESLDILFFNGEAVIDFSNISSIYFNTTAETNKSFELQSGEKPRQFSSTTTSTTWTEPTYPENTAPTKYYYSISLYSNNYNVIVIDSNSTGTYDYAYIDEDTDFTDGNAIELAGNNSKVFLNNNAFLLNIKETGKQVTFTKLNAIHLEKNQVSITRSI